MSKRKGTWIVFGKDLLKSEVYRSLSKTGLIVYNNFMMKRVMKQTPHKRGNKKWYIVNNGSIEYTYSEALKNGISRQRFARALKELVEKGFIDIAKLGGGFDGDKSLYAISERWRDYGTEHFEKATRPKDDRKGRGFSVYHHNIKNLERKKIQHRRPIRKLHRKRVAND